MERVNYWIGRGAQPTDTVRQLIRRQSRAQAAEQQPTA
jgi:ribosomal protein S16